MSNLSKAQPEQIERMKLDACSTFGPIVLREALHRLCQTHGAGCLDGFERAMIDRIEAYQGDIHNLSDVKEFAIEQLYAAIRDARSYPDNKQPLEEVEVHAERVGQHRLDDVAVADGDPDGAGAVLGLDGGVVAAYG